METNALPPQCALMVGSPIAVGGGGNDNDNDVVDDAAMFVVDMDDVAAECDPRGALGVGLFRACVVCDSVSSVCE